MKPGRNAGLQLPGFHSHPVRIYHSCLTFLFLVAAALQWNDPDPAVWIAFYSMPALLSLAEIFLWIPQQSFLNGRKLLWPMLALATLLYGISLFHGLGPEWYNDEVTRESGGLFIIALHSAIAFWSLPSGRNPTDRSNSHN
ncbi:MAG: transmembrane 220 family protein [Leptospiraceae bacterium]|nr:transmembrane 220 family protein [Leptospiraceae bacterium]